MNLQKKITAYFFLISLVTNAFADALEDRKNELEAQLIQLHEDRSQIEKNLIDGQEQIKSSELSIQECIKNFHLVQVDYQDDQKKFAKQLQQALFWKLNKKNMVWASLADQDVKAGAYFWKHIFEQQQLSLRDQLNKMSALTDSAAAVEFQKEQLQSQLDYQQGLLKIVDNQKNEMQKLLEELVLLQQQEFSKLATKQLANELKFDLNKLRAPLKKIKTRMSREFLGASILDAKKGEPIGAIAEGTVIFSDYLRGLGNVIMVEHGDGYMSLYGNCSKLNKKVGEKVSLGENLAFVGQSGQIGKDALYLEIRKDGNIIQAPNWDSYS
jgi:septal ring factor EnvC (AmiA/AmiB activator)